MGDDEAEDVPVNLPAGTVWPLVYAAFVCGFAAGALVDIVMSGGLT
jgi:hypothetical protein